MFFQYRVSVYQISSTQLVLAFLCKRKTFREKSTAHIHKIHIAASDLYVTEKE